MITGPLADLVLAALALWGIGGWSHPIHTAQSTRDDAEAAWAFACLPPADACCISGNARFAYWPVQTQQDIITHEVGHCLGLYHHAEADCAIQRHVMCAQVEQLASSPTALDMLRLREQLGRYGVWARPLSTVWPTQHRLTVPMVGR